MKGGKPKVIVPEKGKGVQRLGNDTIWQFRRMRGDGV